MPLLAVTSNQHHLWSITLFAGLVVLLAVVALLSALIALVKIIDRRVVDVLATLKAAAANTESTALISPTADRVDAVLAEGLQHHLFLGRVLGKVRT